MPEQRPLAIVASVEEGVATVRLQGDLDLDSATDLADRLAAADVAGATRVEIDVTDLRYCDSSGIRVLVVAREEAVERGGSLVLRGVSGAVEKVLEITGLLDSFL